MRKGVVDVTASIGRAISTSRVARWKLVGMAGLAMAIGIVGGLGAILFRLMIAWVGVVVGDILPLGVDTTDHWVAMLGPALGLVAVSLITRYLAREVKGHGVPQILEAIALRGGRIRPRVGLFGIIAPAITIGSGGSVGREGPIALIGAAFGSILAQVLKLADQDVSLLVACGAAAGIGATFNAPIAGGFFGLEVVLGTYAVGAMVPTFLASVTGVTVFDAIMGGGAILPIPPYHVINHFALLFAIGLGILVALVGFLYTRGLTLSEDLFDRLRLPFWMTSALGGLAVGAIGLLLPQVLGVGYPTMELALGGHLLLGLLALLFVGKYVATLLTIGAGGSGGVFAPSLFIGGMFGGLYGLTLHTVGASLAPHPAIYAVAGMAAMFAAAAQAPFVAITILLEITGDYHLTAPVVAAAAVSYFVYGFFTRYSMYTVKLSRRGITILRGNDVRPIESIAVQAALEPVPATMLDAAAPAVEAYQALMASGAPFLPVKQDGRWAGIVTMGSLGANHEHWEGARIAQLMLPLAAPVQSTASLDTAARIFALQDDLVLPVQDEATGHVSGYITRDGILRAYSASTIHTLGTAQQIRDLSRGARDPGRFVEVVLPSGSPLAGHTLASLALPAAAVIVRLERAAGNTIPHGMTALQEGDRLLLFITPTEAVQRVRRWFEQADDASATVVKPPTPPLGLPAKREPGEGPPD